MAEHLKCLEGFLVHRYPGPIHHTAQLPGTEWETAGARTVPGMGFGGWGGCFGGSERLVAWLSPVTSWPEGKLWQDFISSDAACGLCVALTLTSLGPMRGT